MSLFNKLFTHAGSFAAFFSALRTHRRFTRETPDDGRARQIVYIELRHNILRRYMYPLVMALLHHYDVRIGITFSLLGRLVDSEKLLLRTPGVRFTRQRPRDAVAILHDGISARDAVPSVVINRDYFNRFGDRSAQVLHFPFPMHPDRYRPDYGEEHAELQGRIKIFFAGNIDPRYYDDPSITGRFGMLSRVALTATIRERLSDLLIVPRSYEEFTACIANGSAEQKIVFVDLGRFGIPARRFLSVLDHADFFLALPGTKVPHSHNCIEALSRGCIPILQYGDLFPQPLTHRTNSLRYTSADEFIRVIREAVAMVPDDVRRMSEAATNYYRTALSHEAFMQDFEDKIGKFSRLELIINAERRSL